jgi:hypothetical protein
MGRHKYNVNLKKNKIPGVDWAHLAQDRDNWQSVARKGDENLGFIKRGNFLTG